MENKSIRETVLSGLFIAIGLILPMIFHTFGAGSTFLPMHIPVLLGGFVLSAPYAITVGVLTPILSSLLTGMPPAFPVLPYMVFELAAYGASASFLFRKWKLNAYISLIGSMLVGRGVSAIVVWILVSFFAVNLPGPLAFLIAGIAGSIPGMAIQILFIPPIIFILQKNNLIRRVDVNLGSK